MIKRFWGTILSAVRRVTNQAVHELRHKRHALKLHQTARSPLAPHGCSLVCDHYLGEDGMTNGAFYLTMVEQCRCFEQAGFNSV
jgi:hypothetical protein